MPEIKNMFQKGVMNKDLDERLIPNGQYRDAMNVQVSTSEDSEVGTVQNILGNTRVEDIVGSGFKCVGAITDEKNNVLYWFITSPAVDAIIEYRDDSTNQSTNTCTPILVDRNKDVLKFDENNLITGINIIDNLLFWTDDVNEPKKINIDTLKLNPNPNLTTHSQMFVNENTVGDVTEDHITVIRKRPQKAPTITFSETAIQPVSNFYDNQDNQGNGPIPPQYGWADPGGLNFFNKTVGSTYTGAIIVDPLDLIDVYQNGDILLLSQPSTSGNLPQNYQIRIQITTPLTSWTTFYPATGTGAASHARIFDFEILEMDQNYGDGVVWWDAVLEVDKDPIFEKDFIRFATRWKYADGEYSAFSPFTQPVFLTGSFGFHPTEDPYNLAMQSQALGVKLQDLIPSDTPNDVIQLDILFKKERSTTIYSIDSIKPNDPSPNYWNKNNYSNQIVLTDNYPIGGSGTFQTQFLYDYTGEYNITVENIYAALPENQMLRPWDNVPRKALAQEITANRVVYGNYLQNYNLKDYLGNITKPNIIVDKEERRFNDNAISFAQGLGKKSIKSLRTYYLGVVYGDKQGRETPIFTSKDASARVPYDLDDGPIFNGAPNKSLRLTAKLLGEQPEWAHYYKYFVKQTTGEYYNLTMDRVYKSQEDKNLWLSFPSSDRNKIQEGDYFILKKQVDIEQIVPVEAKIKIIDIKNEAPESIKYNFLSLGTATENAPQTLWPNINEHPAVGVAKLLIDKETWINSEGGLDLQEGTTNSDRLAVQFQIVENNTTMKSRKYFVSAWSIEDGGTDGRYALILGEPINISDTWVESSSGVLNADKALSINIMKLESKDATEFEGRFFVKVISNPVTQTYLVPSTSDTDVYQTLGNASIFTLADLKSTLGLSPGIEGIYNTEQSSWIQTTSNNISDTEGEWDTITTFDTGASSNKGWFIDSAGFVAAQQETHTGVFPSIIDAKLSGKMTKGNPFSAIGQYINGLEGIVSPDQSSGQYAVNNTATPQQGGRHWSSNVIPMLDSPPGGALGWGNGYQSGPTYDNTYIPSSGGGHWMHLSFSCPGEDLHNAGGWPSLAFIQTWPTSVQFPGGYLQKIASSGGYTAWPNGVAGGIPAEADDYSHNSDLSSSLSWAFGGPEANEVSNNQFNPSWKNLPAQGVVDNLVAGSKFRIEGDDTEIYTIIRVHKKLLYNHTAWNLNPTYPSGATGVGDINVDSHPNGVNAISSVSEAYNRLINSISGAASSAQIDDDYTVFKDTVYNFGKANNRRVCYILELDKSPLNSSAYAASLGTSDHDTSIQFKFIDNYIEDGSNTLPTSPAIFETEAKEDVDLNIYYEASDALPVKLETDSNSITGHLLAPIGCKVTCSLINTLPDFGPAITTPGGEDIWTKVKSWSGNQVELNSPGLIDLSQQGGNNSSYIGETLTFWKKDLSYTQAKILSVDTISNLYITHVTLELDTHKEKTGLPYYNCFSFGNGVESNRIRDDFNESFILNGVKASTVLEEPYEEERRKYGLIYSGLYNSTSGVNNLNQFIQAEKITKDLMPSYGSIQKLYARDKDLITLCEDKIIRVYVDKDILYNADGNTQLLATNRVLGTAEPFRGNFGISKNPESFAAESFRAYFTDKQRGAVIRLSMDGLTPISDAGMHDFFRDNLRDGGRLYGNYDIHKGDYNLSIYFEDGENNVLNPGFKEGFFEQAQAGSEILTNNSFANYTTVTTPNLPDIDRQCDYNAASQDGSWEDNTIAFNASVNLSGVEVGMAIKSVDYDVNGVADYTGIQSYSLTVTHIDNVSNPQIVTIDVPDQVTIGLPPIPQDFSDVFSPLNGLPGNSSITFGHWDPNTLTYSVDDWNSTSAIFNIDLINGNTITISPAGSITQVVSGASSLVIDSNKEYRVEANVTNVSGHPTLLVGGTQITLGGDPILGAGQISEVVTFPQDINSGDNVYFTIPGWSLNGTITLTNISIKELTPYGGNVTHWDLNGGNNASNIYTYQTSTGDEKIVFDGAPLGTYLHQNLTYTNRILDFDKGTKCNVSFNVTNSTIPLGQMTFRLYNSDGQGFEYAFGGDGSYMFSRVIGDATSTDINVIDKFGFYVSTPTTSSCEIDNVSIVLDGEGAGKTISFNEKSKGWTSFKSFVPEFALSCVNQYYTMNLGQLWKHHVEQFDVSGKEINRNTFYGVGPGQDASAESSITPILNMQPDLIKNFNTLNYEGSQSKVLPNFNFLTAAQGWIEDRYDNLISKDGWYVYDIHTDKQEGTLHEFIEKEGKWFNYIKGKPGQVDTAAFNFQGLGMVETIDIL